MNKELDEIREELVSSRKSNDTEDLLDQVFTDPVGLIFAKLCIKLGITPNGVTILSGIFGIAGGVLFYFKDLGLNLLGIALQIFGNILDSSDGQVARLTHNCSRFGRVLDGVSDGLCFAAVYLALGARLMTETIPFTDKTWGLLIWPIVFFTGLVPHLTQARMADYYRNAHLYFLGAHSEFSHSDKVADEIGVRPEEAGFLTRLYLNFYRGFTAKQEKMSPKLHALMDRIDERGGCPAGLAESFVTQSRRYIQLTNILTFNARAYTLYLLVALGLHVWYYPFVILLMGAISGFMVRRYEAISARLLKDFA